MAGHSKWNNIKHRKERQDAKRAKIFTKLSKEIFAAVREAGDDPSTNLRLRSAIAKAKAENIPGDNVDRTIKKASGDTSGIQYEEITYEGYGPGGAAVMVEVLTDNKNRSVAEIRHAFNKNGGNMGESGCVAFMFHKNGFIFLSAEEVDEETAMLDAIEAGADDVEREEEVFTVTVPVKEHEKIRAELEGKGYKVEKAEVLMEPETTVELNDEHAEAMIKLIDVLEENDDVQDVHHNFAWNETQEQLNQ